MVSFARSSLTSNVKLPTLEHILAEFVRVTWSNDGKNIWISYKKKWYFSDMNITTLTWVLKVENE